MWSRSWHRSEGRKSIPKHTTQHLVLWQSHRIFLLDNVRERVMFINIDFTKSFHHVQSETISGCIDSLANGGEFDKCIEECPLRLFVYQGLNSHHRVQAPPNYIGVVKPYQWWTNLKEHRPSNWKRTWLIWKKHSILNFESGVFICEDGYQNQYEKVSLSCEELILLPRWSRSGLNPVRPASTISQPLSRFRCLMTRGSPISKQKCAAEPPSIRYSNMSPHHCQR